MSFPLVFNRKEWEASDFSITKEELDLAEKHPQGFIKKGYSKVFGPVDCYLTKKLKI